MSAWRLHVFAAALLCAAQLIKVLSCGYASAAGGAGGAVTKRFAGLYTGPYFDPAAPNNITAQLGTHAYLPCKVRQLSNKSVSWIRRRDAHILTVDRFTFIADERFQAFLVESSDTWTLQVKYVQARDAGLYECQVGTEPKMSHFVQLNVVVPVIAIAGEAEVFVRAGSTVRLRCVVSRALEEPAYIFWFHNERRLLPLDARLALTLERHPPDTTVGVLSLAGATRDDSGNYSCAPSGLAAASVALHVLSGEQPAAMQHGNAASTTRLSLAAALACALSSPLATALACALASPLASTLTSTLSPSSSRHSLLFLVLLATLLLISCHDEGDSK